MLALAGALSLVGADNAAGGGRHSLYGQATDLASEQIIPTDIDTDIQARTPTPDPSLR